MFVHLTRTLIVTGIIALAGAPAAACLVCTPSPAPGHSQPPIVRGPEPTPAPPTILNYRDVDGWRVGFAEYDPNGTVCNRPSTFVGKVFPGRNTTWLYYFKHSDGYTSQPIEVPAAPNIPGGRLGGKDVTDVNGPDRPGVADSLVVVENKQAIQTELIPTACR